jgi:hypothetical protein
MFLAISDQFRPEQRLQNRLGSTHTVRRFDADHIDIGERWLGRYDATEELAHSEHAVACAKRSHVQEHRTEAVRRTQGTYRGPRGNPKNTTFPVPT